MKIYLLLFLSSLIGFAFSANILCVFSKPAFSHQQVFRGITEELLKNGHQLTIMSTHPSDDERHHQNVSLIDVSFSVDILKRAFDELFDTAKSDKTWKSAFYKIVDTEASIVDKQLSSDDMTKLLNDDDARFDLLLLETGGMSPIHALAEHFNIPVVGVSSADAFSASHEIMGNVINPIAHPDRILPFRIAKSFTQQVGSCLYLLLMKFIIAPRVRRNYEPILKKHFPNIKKSHDELLSNVDLQLVNAHPAIGFNRPILSNTIQLGFLHIKPPKPLSYDLLNIMDRSAHGIIYMSFGTIIVEKLVEKNVDNFMKAFADLPYDVLWKYDDANFTFIPSNVHLRKWFPQSDLLAHPNVKLFITHGVSI